MTGAVALAIVLVIAVAGVSMAMQSQRTMQGTAQRGPRIPRPPRPERPAPRQRPTRDKDRPKERKAPAAAAPPNPPAEPKEPEFRAPDLSRAGTSAEAKVISVVDERTTGPVTRSRLSLEIHPSDGPPFEVTVRVAFPTPEARASVKVGGTVPVRYDADDKTRVVVDIPQS